MHRVDALWAVETARSRIADDRDLAEQLDEVFEHIALDLPFTERAASDYRGMRNWTAGMADNY